VIYVGIDPGKAGAIATMDESGKVIDVIPTPMINGPRVRGKNGKMRRGPEDYDIAAIGDFLRARCDRSQAGFGLYVTVERLEMLPGKRRRFKGGPLEEMGGAKANYNRGVSKGWLWMLGAFRIPHQTVLPQTWQRTMFKGMPGTDPKVKSIAAAKRAWPMVSLYRTPKARTDDDGLSDALWLAEYGRRMRAGGPVFAAAAQK
jgi:hypothetical protein